MPKKTYKNIELKMDIPVQEILSFQADIRVNQHAVLDLQVLVKEETSREWSRTLTGTEIILSRCEKEKKRILFAGEIQTVSSSQNAKGEYGLAIRALSWTVRLDRERKSHSFQNTEQTFAELVKAVGKRGGAGVIAMAGKKQKLPYPYIQYEETDWEFSRRVASNLCSFLLPDARSSRANYWLGMRKGKERKMELYYTGLGISDQYYILDGKSMKLNRNLFFYYDTISRQDYDIGDYLPAPKEEQESKEKTAKKAGQKKGKAVLSEVSTGRIQEMKLEQQPVTMRAAGESSSVQGGTTRREARIPEAAQGKSKALECRREELVEEQEIILEKKEKKKKASQKETSQKGLMITQKRIVFQEGELWYCYRMGTEALLLQPPCYNKRMGGLSLPGTIVTTENCQAHIRLDMDGEKGESCFGYPWTPETGNLMYCMPKPGTRAMLYLDSHCEGYARVVCSPRTNGHGTAEESEGFGDYNNRKLETEFGKSFEMTPTGTLLKGGDGTGGTLELGMHDDAGIHAASPQGITLAAAGSIVLDAPRVRVEGKMQELVLRDSASAGQFIPCIVPKGSRAEACTVLTPGGNAASGIQLCNRLDIMAVGNTLLCGTDRESYAMIEDHREEAKFDWGKLALGVLGGMIAALGVAALVLATGGIAAAFLPAAAGVITTVTTSAAIGAAVMGTVTVGARAIGDVRSGNVSDGSEYVKAGEHGAIVGAVTGAIGGGFEVVTATWGLAATMTAMGVDGAIETWVENKLNGVETHWWDLVGAFGFSALTYGVMDNLARKWQARRAAKQQYLDELDNYGRKLAEINEVPYDEWLADAVGGKGTGDVNLLDDSGKFCDDILENNYQKYVNRKQQRGQPPRDRMDWKEASDYWTKNSPVARGNNFNKKVRESGLYDYHELHLANGKRLDSYDPQAGEIISRKATDLDQISESTYRRYLSEFSQKYSVGTKIRSNAYSELDGLTLDGKYILEIPSSNANLPNIEDYKKIASEYDVVLRFTDE